MIAPDDLYRSPNALVPFYTSFRVGERLLLTGHSHQAWPDCGFRGQQQAWLDAAECLDRKWERAFARAELVRRGFARLLDDTDGEIALGSSVHELVVRFLSALPFRNRPRIVTTDGEFHSLRRQLDRARSAEASKFKPLEQELASALKWGRSPFRQFSYQSRDRRERAISARCARGSV